MRYQQVLFRLTQLVVDNLIGGATGPNADALRQSRYARHQLFAPIYRVVSDFIDTKVTFAKRPDGTTVDKRGSASKSTPRACASASWPASCPLPLPTAREVSCPS